MPDPQTATQPLAEAAVERFRLLFARTSPSIALATAFTTSVRPDSSDAEVAAIARALIAASADQQDRRADDLAATAARIRAERNGAWSE